MASRRYYILLTAITLCAWGFRLAVTERFVGLEAVPSSEDGLDQLDYDLLAFRMSEGLGYTLEDGLPTARRTPGTSLLLLPIYSLCGRSYVLARIWFALLSALTCWGVARLVRPGFGPVAALLSAAILAFDPGSFYYTLHLWSEPGYGFLLTWATVLSVESLREQSRGKGLLAGLCWGFAILVRAQVIFALPFVVVAILISQREQRWPYARAFVLQMSAAAGVVLPWIVRNAVVMGKPCLATLVGGFTFFGAHNSVTFENPAERGSWVIPSAQVDPKTKAMRDEIAKEKIAWDLGMQAVREHWSEMPRLLVAKIGRLLTPFEPTSNRAVFWAFAASWLMLSPLVAIGMMECWRRDRVLATFLATQFAGVLLSTLVFYGAARFRHAVEPLMMVCAGAAVAWAYAPRRRALSANKAPSAGVGGWSVLSKA